VDCGGAFAFESASPAFCPLPVTGTSRGKRQRCGDFHGLEEIGIERVGEKKRISVERESLD
jgi:hypothetical protein